MHLNCTWYCYLHSLSTIHKQTVVKWYCVVNASKLYMVLLSAQLIRHSWTDSCQMVLCGECIWTVHGTVIYTVAGLKPLHTIGKVSLNDSILSKNQEICNKTNLWKFQLISLFVLRENSKKCIQHLCIHSNGQSFCLTRRKLIIGSYFTNYSKTITHQAEIFQGKLSTIVIFIPWCKLCVNLFNIFVFWSNQCCAGALLNSLKPKRIHIHKQCITSLLRAFIAGHW